MSGFLLRLNYRTSIISISQGTVTFTDVHVISNEIFTMKRLIDLILLNLNNISAVLTIKFFTYSCYDFILIKYLWNGKMLQKYKEI